MAEIDGARTGARASRSGPLWPLSAAPRCPPRSTCSSIWSAKLDVLVVGGAMANTFLAGPRRRYRQLARRARALATVRRSWPAPNRSRCEIVLPTDVVVAKELKPGAAWHVCDVGAIPADAMILDLGPRSVADLNRHLAAAKTLLWNGPLGAFEIAPFGEGTFALAREAARLTKAGKLISVAGGGDTVAALNAARRRRRLHLCLDRGRRLPRMAGRPRAACGCRAGKE